MVADKVDDKRFGGSVGEFCNGSHKKRKRATVQQSDKYDIKPPMKMVLMYMGFIFYEDFYIEVIESITSAMEQEEPLLDSANDPLGSIDDLLESGNSANVPLNNEDMSDIEKKWDDLKRENDNNFSIEEKLDFREFNRSSAQHSDPFDQQSKANGAHSDINGSIKQRPASSGTVKNEAKNINGAGIDQQSKIRSTEINTAQEEEKASVKKVRWTKEEEPPSKPCGSCDVAVKGKCEYCSFLRKETDADTLEVYFLKDQVEPWQGINIPRRVLHEAGTTAVLQTAEARELIQAGIALLATEEV